MNVAILVGGKGRRMGYVEKALLEICGVRIIDRLLKEFRDDNVVIVCRDEKQRKLFEVETVVDSVKDFGALAGIHAALKYFGERTLVLACDMPFAKRKVAEKLFSEAENINANVLMPYWKDGRFEPLFSIYSPEIIPEIEKSFSLGEKKILKPVFRSSEVYLYSVECLRKLDEKLISFFNVNTPQELRRAEELCSSTGSVE